MTLSDNIEDGIPTRVVVRDGIGYVATWRKGLQVVNVNQARDTVLEGQPDWQQAARLFEPGGQAVNPGALVATIPVGESFGASLPGLVLDLKVGEYTVAGVAARLIVATGSPRGAGLVIADPTRPVLIYQAAVESSGVVLERGEAVALAASPIGISRWSAALAQCLEAGPAPDPQASSPSSTSRWLALSPQGTPTALSWFRIDHSIGDILIRGDEAFVSSGASESNARELNR